jgi:putative ATP-dependent endonuclease of the OLD family
MTFPFISRVEIENFRNLHGLQADLAANTVLVGENRAGKSNLVHALRIVLDPSLPDSQRMLRAEDFWDGLDQAFSGNRIVIRMDLQGFDNDSVAESVLGDCIVGSFPLTARLTYEFRPRSKIQGGVAASTESDYEFVIYGGSDEAHQVGSQVRRWLSLTVLPAMRDAEEQLQAHRRTLLRPLIDRVRPLLQAEAMEEARALLDDASGKLLAQAPVMKLQGSINDRLVDMVGRHQAVATKLAFASSDPQQLLRSLRLFLDEGKTRAMGDASLGTANLIYLCLLLQELDERLRERASAGTLLAIEEPEAHLHPHVQRLLFRYALRRDHSIVVTTHSTHIASVAPLRALRVLRTDKDGTSRMHGIDGAGLSEAEVMDVERYLDVTRAEMVFARGIIFVEGPTEEFLVPAFARFEMERRGLGSSLDEIGITVCSVSGTDFRPYWRVTAPSGWAIPRVVITDGDAGVHSGVRCVQGLIRGARLLQNSEAEKAASAGDEAGPRAALEAEGIFVGATTTLEQDLLASLASEVKETYAGLISPTSSISKRVNFSSAVESASAGDVQGVATMLARIEEIGKGRFAQRLASAVTAAHEPPPHIKRALARIFDLVRHA